MSDLKIQGVVEMSSEGAENALDRLGNKAEQMAADVARASDQAGKAVNGIADGAANSAEQFTRAEGRMSASIKRATTNLELLGKNASQKLEFKISQQGLDATKFEPLLAKLRELEAAQTRVNAATGQLSAGVGGQFSNNVRNAAFQVQDFAVQVNGGVDATKALGMQLPQLLGSFGMFGAVLGVAAALLPNLVQAFSNTADGSKTLDKAMGDLNKAVGDVGSTVKNFDMDKLYEEFNKASKATRQAIVDQLDFQQKFIETQRLISSKKFGESLGDLGAFGTLDKLAGAFASSGAEKLAKQLGISAEAAKDLLPVINGLKAGTADVNGAFNQFGTVLLGGNAKAIELASTMNDLARAERDAAAASTAISEAQAKMAKGHVQTKKEAEDEAKARKAAADAAQREAEALQTLLDTINGKSAAFDSNYVKNVTLLLKEYDKGALSLTAFNEVFARYAAMQPGAVAAAKELAKAEEEAAKRRDDYTKNLGDETERLLQKAKASEQELAAIGLSADELGRLVEKRYDEQIAIKVAEAERLRGIDGREAEVYLIEQQISALERLKAVEVAKPRLQAQAREWDNFARDIERSLTDALFRAFESGDSFGKAFAKSLENTFKTMALKLVIQATVTGGGNLINSGINAVLGTSGNNDGAGVDYLGVANKASTANSLYNAGAFVGNALFGSGSGTVASWLAGTTAVSPASVAAANLTGAMGGDALGSLIAAEGWSTTAAAGAAAAEASAAAAAASAATAAEAGAAGGAAASAGSLAWVPYVGWAAAAAAAIYAFKDKIFGGDWEASGAPRMVGGFSEAYQGMTSGYTLQDYKKDGGWFGSDKEETRATAISSEFDRLLDRMYTSMRDNYVAVGKLFDDNDLADKLVGFAQRVEIADATNLQAAFEKMAKDLGDAMGRTLFPSIAALQAAGEDFAATFQRVVGEAEAVNKAFAVLGTTLGEQFGRNNADKVLRLSDSLVKLFGGIDTMLGSVAKYYAGYYSPTEQQDIQRQAFAAQFAALGVAMPETRTQFRRLVDSLDLTSAAGQQAYATLINMSEAFGTWVDGLTNGVDEMTAQIEQAMSGLFDGLLQQIQGAREGLAGAVATVSGIGLMTPAEIRAAIAGASPNLPSGSTVLSTQEALSKAQSAANSSISSAIALRDAEQAAVNQRNQGWSYLVADLPNIGGWSFNGGEQLNEMWNIYNSLSAAGLGTGFSGWSNYRDSSATFNPLPSGYQYFLDGQPIGASLQLNHWQDGVSANGITWGRYDRNLDVYAYKPYGTETINPWYDQNVANAKTAGATAITTAEQAAVQAQIDYTKAIQQYVIDAGKAVEKLNNLRDETVKYYEAQQQLANTLLTSAGNLREAVKQARQSQLSEADLLAQRRQEFNRYYSLGLATTGATQAGYADKMAGLLPTLVASLENTAGSSADWARASASLYAQSNAIAGMLETQAAVDYQTEALGLLGAIDTTLGLIEANASSAEKLITDAIYATGNTNAAGLRAVIAAIQGKPIPAFASGGSFSGGWRLVGENGPELEATGPARIFNSAETSSILGGGTRMGDVVAELQALRQDNAELRGEVRAVAGHTFKTARQLEQVIGDGVIVRTESGYPLETTTA